VICWVGTRGLVPLTAALSVPLTIRSGAPFPHRDLLLVLTSSCILVTLVVQGLTLAPVVRRLGVTEDPAERRDEEALARHDAARAATARLDELLDLEAVPEVVIVRLREEVRYHIRRTEAAVQEAAAGRLATEGSTSPSQAATEQVYRAVRRDLLTAEAAELLRLRAAGSISEAVRRRIQRSLDVRESELED
jgi:NhaP-type Na+/H+ or K+/H+ antiporter